MKKGYNNLNSKLSFEKFKFHITRQKTVQILVDFLLSVFLVMLDQITKHLAVLHLKGRPPFVLIQEVFELYYLENQGMAFSMLWGQKNFFVIATIFLFSLMLYLYLHLPAKKRFFAARMIFLLFLSGAVGNFIDRCFNHYVVDFFYFKLINFAVFNVADIYITVGAALFILFFGFIYKEEEVSEILPFFK